MPSHHDEIVEEIHKFRQAHAAALGNDLKRIAEDIRRQERTSLREKVALPPRKPRLSPVPSDDGQRE